LILRVAVTGPEGFLAWHLCCTLSAKQEADVVSIGRPEFQNAALMDSALANVDCVIHLAGVNRGTDQEIATTNPMLARLLAEGLVRAGKPITVIHGNSTHSRGDSAFGQSKTEAASILRASCEVTGGSFVDVVLPNVFGEHGRPFYNSVVATFCHQLAIGEKPSIEIDRELPLIHAQEVAEILLNAAANPVESEILVEGRVLSVSAVLAKLQAISGPYFEGRLPDLSDSFTRDLFNTYRSYTFPGMWPILPVKHSDDRGELVEAVRGAGGETQVFFSTTKPGFARGNHFHLRKVERFLVLNGQASIKLRRLFTSEVIEFLVEGETPAIVDMPTLWTHSITNTGNQDLLTLFYADDEYNPDDPDTYWVDV
jgi:UDP-2-acetamido-2,6-beta-L-arabino-hexul-4-ose reductase